jgi:hypothetical protein
LVANALIALQEDLPVGRPAHTSAHSGGAGLDFVHLACLARGWTAPRQPEVITPIGSWRVSGRATAMTAAHATMPGAAHG